MRRAADPAQAPVLAAEAADDRTRAREVALGVRGQPAVVDARGRIATPRRERHREAPAHAEPDHADATGARRLRRQPGTDHLDVVEGGPAPGGDLAHRGAHAGELAPGAVEVGRGDQEPLAGEPVGVLAERLGHAEGVVEDDHPGHGPAPAGLAV